MNESWKKTSSCRLLEVIYDEIVPYSVVYFLICKFSMLLFLYQVIANTSAFYNYKTMHDYANMVKTVCRRIVSLHDISVHFSSGIILMETWSIYRFIVCLVSHAFLIQHVTCENFLYFFVMKAYKTQFCLQRVLCVHLITYLSSFQSVDHDLLVNHRENYSEREWNCVSGLSNAHMKVRVLSFTYFELTDKIIVLIIYNRILWSIHAM